MAAMQQQQMQQQQFVGQNSLEAMLQKKQQLDDDLRMVERLICDSEEQYLEETNHYGNVVKGWDGFLTSRPRPVHASSHHGSKRSNVTVKERIFSVSSTSAPIEHPMEHSQMQPQLTIGGVGAGVGGAGEVSMEEMESMGAAPLGPPIAYRQNSKANPINPLRQQAKTEEGEGGD